MVDDTTPRATPELRAIGKATALICVCIIVAATQGCASLRRLTSDDESEAAAAKLQQLQLKVMRFADEYVGGVLEAARRLLRETLDPVERLAVQDWKLSQATAAYSIASGPNPVTNSLDMVVLATLSRMVMEDTWVEESYGARAMALRDAHRRLEPDAWSLVAETLTATQIEQLHQTIDRWRAANPRIRAVSYVHFLSFARSVGQPREGEVQPLGGLFSLLGIDPLSSLDPAVREIAQTRQLAERAIYYVQRAPALMDMEVERLSYVLAAMPETRAMLATADRAGRAAQAVGGLAEHVPELIASEREASIRQFMQELSAQQRQMLALVAEFRAALEAGATASDSVHETLRDVDALLARFPRRGAEGPAASRAAQRSFDIKDYSNAAREFAATAQRIESLVAQLDASAPRVGDVAQRAADDVRALVNFALWRLAALVVLSVAAVLAAALVYRSAGRRKETG